ncbi:sensor histidine kinase [Roseateles chitinivorans]|uniref:sensor histidine kinase n=1 Tax=Roseateles chitinivorans TaxID=2917965 RepID=UPI003D68000B
MSAPALPSWRRAAAALFKPSLVRRLLIAQMLLLTLLWSLGFAYLVLQGARPLLESRRIYETINGIADELVADPERLRRVMDRAHEAIVEDFEKIDDPQPSFIVEQRGRIVYRSPKAPTVVPAGPLNEEFPLRVDGVGYLAKTVRAPSGTRTTMFARDHGMNVFITIYSKSFYLLPLLISLPFLLLPAWLSIRLAMRPWTGVAREMTARGPQDLSPLAYRGRHRELAGMVDAINGWMRRVRDSSERERSFVADAAHELRTPLAAMLVNVEALKANARDERERQLMAGVMSSGHRATRMVNQLLRLMRSEAHGSDPVERVELDRLLQDRLAVLSPLASARSVELELTAAPGLCVAAPLTSLESLVDNLVENAVKYGPVGGTVRVMLKRAGGEAVLYVTDQGPGIPPSLRERVFDRFFRDPAQREPGSGLGLSIVKAVLEQLGGRIEMRDGLGNGDSGGLEVAVTLPLAQARADTAP